MECPACGKEVTDGELAQHVQDCRDLNGSGELGSKLDPKRRENRSGPRYGESARKPSLDFYDRH